MNDFSPGLGLGRIDSPEGPVAVWYRQGEPSAVAATVEGRHYADLPELLAAADGDFDTIGHGRKIDVAEDDLLVPIGRPRKILCVGRNYLDHLKEGGRDKGPERPEMFPKWDNTLTRPGGTVPLPPESDKIDFEAELAIVIGKRCRRVPEDAAAPVVFGYTAANDGSVRDFQFRSHQAAPGKAWDGMTPLGPVVVPATDLGGAQPDLAIQGVLNDEVMQDGRTGDMIFSVGRMIAFISTFLTLEPGDVILTGTPAGVGYARNPKVLLKHGDTYAINIEGIGSLVSHYATEEVSA